MAEVDFRKTLINPLPSQEKCLDAMYEYDYILFGGQAGPGKSYILHWGLAEFLMEVLGGLHLKNVDVGLFCEDYPSLKDRQITNIHREFPKWLGEIKDTKEDGLHFGFHEKYGSQKIKLRNLDDPSKYASAQFAAIGVDELTKNDRQTFDDLRFRKRWPGIEHSPFIAASNPGSKGHVWVKKLFLDRDFSGEPPELNPRKFLFIPARGRENPYLPESYWETLKSLPEKMRKAMLEGNWDIFVGQYFSEWNRDIHVIEPFGIPNYWKRIICADYGFENPSAILWVAIDPEGAWWVYRELYERKLTYENLGERCLEMMPLNESVEYAVLDPACWGDRPRHEETPGQSGAKVIEDILDKRDIPLIKGNHDRVQGWQRIRQLMAPFDLPDKRKGSNLHVFSTCVNFIRTIPSLVHDDIKPEDLDTDGDDHIADALRYGVNTKFELEKQENRLSSYVREEIPTNGGFSFR